MKVITFDVPGAPTGKARHRMTKMGHTYTPKITENYENLVKMCFREVCKDAPCEGKVELFITAIFPIPKSASKKKRQMMIDGEIRPTTKPDWDNLGKIISDALNQVAFHDDAQVTDGKVRKKYGLIPMVSVGLVLRSS